MTHARTVVTKLASTLAVDENRQTSRRMLAHVIRR
jgi:hypothetical protein